jgi:hypothetical protein
MEADKKKILLALEGERLKFVNTTKFQGELFH